MRDLYGAKILLFYPYGATKHYGDSIKLELIKRGAKVIEYDERPSQNSFMKAIIRIFKKRINYIFHIYINRIIKKNKNANFDYILVLRGEAFTRKTLELLKKNYKSAILILYLWDILRTTKMEDVIPYFDHVFSFDPQDVSKNKYLKFRPTFFIPEYKSLKKVQPSNQVLFIGTIHSRRYQILNKFKTYMNNNKISLYFYLYIPSILVFIKKILFDNTHIKLNLINFKPISLNKTLLLVSKSVCILDINFTNQKSLSMRAYEAMASKTKLITTNENIKNYNFYNPNNILIVNEHKIKIPKDFFKTPFEEIPNQILNQYSVSSVIDTLFGITAQETNYYFKRPSNY